MSFIRNQNYNSYHSRDSNFIDYIIIDCIFLIIGSTASVSQLLVLILHVSVKLLNNGNRFWSSPEVTWQTHYGVVHSLAEMKTKT